MFKLMLATLVIAVVLASPVMAQSAGETAMSTPTSTDRVAVNGVELYYEVHGEGSPLVMLHGGVNPSDMFGAPLAEMAKTHKVIAIHLRGHGLSTDGDEPWSYELMADDVAALLGELGIDKIDVMGWSLGGGVSYQLAIRHPELVAKLIVISMNVRSDGNFPEVEAAFDAMPGMAADYAKGIGQSPLAKLYPDVDWESMFRKTGEMNQGGYDWSDDIAGITSPTLLIFSDADMMHPEHMIEIYKLLGGGTGDAGVDGSTRPTPNQLAIIPGTTHYDLMLKATQSATDYARAFLANEALQQTGESVGLPFRLAQDQRCGQGDIDRAQTVAHRNADAQVGRFGHRVRYAGAFAPDHQDVAWLIGDGIGRGLGLGGQQYQPALLGPPPGIELAPADMFPHARMVDVIEPRAGQRPGREGEARRVDDVNGGAQAGAEPDQGAGVVGNVGLVESEIDRHGFPTGLCGWRVAFVRLSRV